MKMRRLGIGCAFGLLVGAAFFFHQFYFPARDGVIYACGVIAGQDSVSETDREASYCVRWRERAESVGFNPFGKASK